MPGIFIFRSNSSSSHDLLRSSERGRGLRCCLLLYGWHYWLACSVSCLSSARMTISTQFYGLGVRVDFFGFDFTDYLLSDSLENLLNFFTSLSRSLEKCETVHGCKLLSVFVGHLSLVLDVYFVTHQHNLHFFVAVILYFVEPAADVVERISLGDIVHQEGSNRSTMMMVVPLVVGPSDCFEGLLPSLGNYKVTVSQIWILMVRSLMIVFLEPNYTPRVGS